MTPQFLINDALSSFGQFSGRVSEIEDSLWEVIWEIEFVLRPDESIRHGTFTFTDNSSYLSYSFVEPPNVFDINFVENPVSGRRLHRTGFRDFFRVPRFMPTGSLFAFRHSDETILINRDNGLSPNLNYSVSYYVYSDRVPSTTDVPMIERFFPVIRLGLLSRLASKVKDLERYNEFRSRYEQILYGGSGQEGGS